MVLVSAGICLKIGDWVFKALRLPKEAGRIMVQAGSSLSTDRFGVRRYEPNKEVEKAVFIDLKMFYRYKYRTNNLGLISEYDYKPGENLDLMIAGDSMTEGEEVGPWLDKIQHLLLNLHGITSQNFGIAGNGFIEFQKSAIFAKNNLKARKAMIIFIADDMYRPGDIMVANDKCSTYKKYGSSEFDCFSGRPTWHHYDINLSNEELALLAKGLERHGLLPSLKKPLIKIARQIVRLLCKTGLRINSTDSLANRINSECEAKTYSRSGVTVEAITIPNYTVNSLRKILHAYGTENVLMVLIPGGMRVFKELQPKPFLDNRYKGEFESGINYVDISESCAMPPELWSKVGHPVKEGYLKLQSCFLSNKEIMQFAIK